MGALSIDVRQEQLYACLVSTIAVVPAMPYASRVCRLWVKSGKARNEHILSKRRFVEVDQQQAFYSATPEKHEQARNGPRNCKTLIGTALALAWVAFILIADVGYPSKSDRIADIAEGPSCAKS